MEFKDFKHEIKDITEKGLVTIAISSLNNKDSDHDIIRPGAFTKTFKEGKNRIKHVYQHDIKNILGLPVKLYETESYAIAESQLNLEKQSVRDVFSDYKFFKDHGRTLEHSIGFIPVRTQENDDIKGIDITEVKLFEYSTVTLGANENTPLLDMKSFNTDQLEEYLRKYDPSNEKGQYIEKIIFAIKALGAPSTDTLQDIFNEPRQSTLDSELDNILKELRNGQQRIRETS